MALSCYLALDITPAPFFVFIFIYLWTCFFLFVLLFFLSSSLFDVHFNLFINNLFFCLDGLDVAVSHRSFP
jgi:hypothetical protein